MYLSFSNMDRQNQSGNSLYMERTLQKIANLQHLISIEKDTTMILKYASALKLAIKLLKRINNKILTLDCGINKERLAKAKMIGGYLEPPNFTERIQHVLDEEQTIIRKELSDMCYVCKVRHFDTHPFYHSMCTKCGDFNYEKRSLTRDLTGCVAIVTGGRIKIGFEIVLKLLRANCHVIATTRFPTDAEKRFAAEKDYSTFKDRLTIVKLDLLDLDSIIEFTKYVEQEFGRLDILINNAAQTIDRPPEFYSTLMVDENGKAKPTIFTREFPDMVDENGIQFDLREKNTWVTKLVDTELSELLGVTCINYFAPFIIMKHLKPLMKATAFRTDNLNRCAFVINVTSMEAKYTTADYMKTDRHVHNNGAKAALNMITRSIAFSWQRENIFVNSVDTGYVTDEFPWVFSTTKNPANYQKILPPVDEIDGASRVLDPIFMYSRDTIPIQGLFLKDYHKTAW